MITQIPPPENPAPLKPRGRGGLVLKKGETFRGEVIRDLGKGEAIIHSGGRTFRASTDLTVKEGGVYEFRVRAAAVKKGLPVLEAMPVRTTLQSAQPRPLERVLHELASSPPPKGISTGTSALLGDLSRVLEGRLFHPGRADTARWISRSIAEGGIFWENRVAKFLLQGMRGGRGGWKGGFGNDLKGMLLELQGSLKKESRDSPECDTLCRKVEEAIDLIQNAQLENIQFLREEGGWAFLLPGRWEEGFSDVDLFLRRSGKKGETGFSMFMEFSSLGPVEVSGSVMEPSISVAFQVKDEQTAEWVRSNLPLLYSALLEKGFMPAKLACVVGTAASGESEAGPSGGQHPDSVNLVI